MKLISWNVAGRKGKQAQQIQALLAREPHIIALQEVTRATGKLWHEALEGADFHVIDSVALLGKNKNFNLLAARWEMQPEAAIDTDYPERVLSARIVAPSGPIEIHNAHIVPGSRKELAKVKMLEAIYARLGRPHAGHRVLCGDFNTPQSEEADGTLVTWADHHRSNFKRWDEAERLILTGLKQFDLPDTYRSFNRGKDITRDTTWIPVLSDKVKNPIGRRFDHLFASASLCATSCDYIHEWREQRLSDHSASETVFAPVG